MLQSSTSTRFDGWLAIFAVICTALAGGCVTVPIDAEIERPALWRVDKPDGSALWLFGTVHWLPNDQQPESWRMDAWMRHQRYLAGQPLPSPWNHGKLFVALQTMDRLVVESIGRPSEGEIQNKIAGIFSKDSCARFASAASSINAVAADTLETPLSIAGQLFLINETRPPPVRDADNVGIEFWLGVVANQRRVPVFALENLELRARVAQLHLSSRSCEERQNLVDRMMQFRSAPRQSQPDQPRAYALWRNGSIDILDQELRRFDQSDPALFPALVSGRNPFWINALLGHIQAPGNVLVAVGMAHLTGPNNLLQLLAEHGIEVKRIQ